MKSVFAVPGTVLPKLKLALGITPVLVGSVVAAFALGALEQKFYADVTSHGELPIRQG